MGDFAIFRKKRSPIAGRQYLSAEGEALRPRIISTGILPADVY